MSSPKQATLKQRILRAVGWSFLGYGVSQVIRLGSNLVMTRLLVPEMFGVMAIAGMVTIILALLSDIGLRQHIVQSARGDDPVFLDTAWVVQIVRGVMMWLVALAAVPRVAFRESRAACCPPSRFMRRRSCRSSLR